MLYVLISLFLKKSLTILLPYNGSHYYSWNLRDKKLSFIITNIVKWLFGRYCISKKNGVNLTSLDRYTHYILLFIVFTTLVLLTQLEISNCNISSKCYCHFITGISIIIKINFPGNTPFRNLRSFQ